MYTDSYYALYSTTHPWTKTPEVDDGATQRTLHLIQMVCLCTISIVGTIGNLIICTALFRGKCKSSEYFILNLAVTDLLVCAVGIPLDVYETHQGNTWPYGAFLCRVIYPLQTLLVLVSIMTLTAMSMERYRAIMTPLKPRLSKPKILIVIGTIWLLSTAVVSPYAKILTITKALACDESWPGTNDGRYYTLALFIIDYCIPLTIITYCYSRAGFELHKKFQEFSTSVQSFQRQDRAMRRRLEQNKRVIKVFSLAVLMFVVCTLPGDAYWMWFSFGNGSTFAYENHFKTFTIILVYANSAINPFIFGACQVICRRRKQGLLRTQYTTKTEVSWTNNGKSTSMRSALSRKSSGATDV